MTFQNYDAEMKVEQNLLAILCMDVALLLQTDIHANIFSSKLHANIYRALKSSVINGRVEDVELMKHLSEPELEYYLQLMDSYVTSSNFDYLLNEVEERYKNRMALTALNQSQSQEIDFDEFTRRVNDLNSMSSSIQENDELNVKDVFERITAKDELLHFTNFKMLEGKIQPVEGVIHVLAARPGLGKTGLALNLMLDLADRYRCIYLNLENSETVMLKRVVGIASKIEINQFPQAKEDMRKKEQITNSISKLKNKNFRIINRSQTIASIRQIVSKESRKGHLVVFVDHVGYIIGEKGKSERDRVTDSMKAMNTMCKDYDCTFIVLAHINRQGTDTPQLEHLKDSGEIEQSGHTVMLLNYDAQENEYADFAQMQLIVAKNRSGPKGLLHFRYDKRTQVFYEGRS